MAGPRANRGGQANEAGSVYRRGVGTVLAVHGLRGKGVAALEVPDIGPYPVALEFETLAAVDDIKCELSDGSHLYIQAKRAYGNNSVFADAVQQWLKMLDDLEGGDRLAIAAEDIVGQVEALPDALRQRRAGGVLTYAHKNALAALASRASLRQTDERFDKLCAVAHAWTQCVRCAHPVTPRTSCTVRRATVARSPRRRHARRQTGSWTAGSFSHCPARTANRYRVFSGALMSNDPVFRLGQYLTAAEAEGLAVSLGAGEHVIHALSAVSSARRERAGELLKAAGIGHQDSELSAAVLQGIAGAKSSHRELVPVWTMLGNEATVGHLTNQFFDVVSAARVSVTCATYNFSATSNMWNALRLVSEQSDTVVCVYVDSDKGDPAGVKARLPRATVYRSATLTDGKPIVSHTKFIVVDQEIVLLTSANFSYNAENRNVEFGLRIRDSGLAKSIEETMASKRGSLYELL